MKSVFSAAVEGDAVLGVSALKIIIPTVSS